MLQPAAPPLENVLIPVAITALVNLAMWGGGQYVSHRKDRVLIQSDEAKQLRRDQSDMRKELVEANQRLRQELGDARAETQHCDKEREALAERVRVLESFTRGS